MSSDPELERLLRDARETLPEPGPEASRRARVRAVAALRRKRPRRLRAAVLIGSALLVSVVLAVVGALVAPSGTAARAIGLGFLPEPGWHALQAATPATPSQPQVAMSANVPFASDDAVLGLAEPSGLPYSTLLTLPPEGIVIVATFTESQYQFLPRTGPRVYPERHFPLRMRDATPISYGTQIRPDEPLGQYQLRATIERWSVDLHVYFGTPRPSPALRAEAQAQLERLVVRRGTRPVERSGSRPATTAAPSAPVVVDRTVSCRPSLIGGIRQIDAAASAGSGRARSRWARPAYAGIKTTVSGSAATAIDEHLVWVAAGRPAPSALLGASSRFMEFPYRVWGTLAVNRVLCRSSSARVAITPRGLKGAAVGGIEEQWDCATPRAVLVRVRAVATSGTALRSYRNFVRTTVPLKEATIVVQTAAGRRLAFARVLESGRSLLYTAPTCFPD